MDASVETDRLQGGYAFAGVLATMALHADDEWELIYPGAPTRPLGFARSGDYRIIFSSPPASVRTPRWTVAPVPLAHSYTFDAATFDATRRQKRFKKFVSQWRSERNSLSSSAWTNVLSPGYQRIIGMGETAVPFILSEMRDELSTGEPDDWFVALWAITGENPIPMEIRGRVKEMAAAWVKWGEQRGYIYGEGMGSRISALRPMGMP